jgi:hypothetical protein
LIEQVVLEPEHHLVVLAGSLECGVGPDQRRERLVVGGIAGIGQVPGSRFAEPGRIGRGGTRTFVEQVRRHRDVTGQAGLPERVGDGAAIGDVQHGRPSFEPTI